MIFLFAVPTLPGVLTAFLASESVLKNIEMLRYVTDVMSGLIPSIDKYAAASSHPQVTSLTLTVFWITGLIQAAYVFLLIAILIPYRRQQKTLVLQGVKKPLVAIIGIVAIIWATNWLVYTGPSPDDFRNVSSLQAMGQFRTGLAFYGVLYFSLGILFTSTAIAATVIWIFRRR